MGNIFYIYELIHPILKVSFYVGKGKNDRMYDHYLGSNKSNKDVQFYLKELQEQDLQPIYNKIEKNLTEQEAFKKEKEWIKFYGLNNLCNESEGGCGGDLISNHPRRSEILNKMRKPRSEQARKNMCVPRSKEHKKNISIATSGKNNPMYRKKFYDIWVEKYGIEEANMRENIRKDKLRIYRTGKKC